MKLKNAAADKKKPALIKECLLLKPSSLSMKCLILFLNRGNIQNTAYFTGFSSSSPKSFKYSL